MAWKGVYCSLFLCAVLVLVQPLEYQYFDYDLSNDSNHTTDTNISLTCVFDWKPCSLTIIGNLILVAFYAALLGFSAKMISDGAELLLDFGLPAGIIGGIVLPLLGAIPDSAMIVFSGASGSREEANSQIAVGMGTLAGSTVMLLTLPWVASLLLGRVDIVNGQGVDEQTSRFSLKSFWKQGVSVFPDVTYSAIVMLITTIPYFIVQGADWHWGPTQSGNITDTSNGQPAYIRNSALATFVFAFVFLIMYLVFQVLYSVGSMRKDAVRREAALKRRVLKQFYVSGLRQFSKPTKSVQAEPNDDSENKPLLPASTQKKYASVWKMHRAADKNASQAADSEKGEPNSEGHSSDKVEEHEVDEPKWKIALKSSFLLIVGVVLVTAFSDPMVDALSALANPNYYFDVETDSRQRGQHIPIPVFYLSFVITPVCSNASEIVSSLIFASKRKRVSTSMTFSQLYGAVTMNNTLCLGVFAALVYFRDLDWQFSAEVTVIILVEFTVGIVAIVAGFGLRNTYPLLLGFFVGALYFLAILLVVVLEQFAKWK